MRGLQGLARVGACIAQNSMNHMEQLLFSFHSLPMSFKSSVLTGDYLVHHRRADNTILLANLSATEGRGKHQTSELLVGLIMQSNTLASKEWPCIYPPTGQMLGQLRNRWQGMQFA